MRRKNTTNPRKKGSLRRGEKEMLKKTLDRGDEKPRRETNVFIEDFS